MFFEGKAEFRQPHAFRNLEEVYPDGQPLPRIDDSDRIEFFESQRFRTGAKGKKEKKKTPEPPPVDAVEKEFAELGRALFYGVNEQDVIPAAELNEFEEMPLLEQIKRITEKITIELAVNATVFNAIPEGGIDAEPAEDAEDADVEVVGVSKKEAKKQVKVKVEPEEVIEPEPESDVDSVDEDTEETQVLDAALKTLPKIK